MTVVNLNPLMCNEPFRSTSFPGIFVHFQNTFLSFLPVEFMIRLSAGDVGSSINMCAREWVENEVLQILVGVVRTSNFRRRPVRLGLTYSSFISVCFLLWSHFDCHLMLCVVNKFRYLHDSICLMCRVTLPWNRTLTIPYRYGIYIYYLFKLFSVFLRVDLLREGMSVFPLMEWSLCTWRGNGLGSWCFGAIWCQEILKTTLTAVLVFCGVVPWYFVCEKLVEERGVVELWSLKNGTGFAPRYILWQELQCAHHLNFVSRSIWWDWRMRSEGWQWCLSLL